jgi:hypothetical protein
MDINNLQNAKLIGATRYARFRDKFNAEWNKPNVEMMKARMWKEMSPAMKAELEKLTPEAVKNMRKRYGD